MANDERKSVVKSTAGRLIYIINKLKANHRLCASG
jgi:hypothetical protein